MQRGISIQEDAPLHFRGCTASQGDAGMDSV
ncbi:hypothetical protein GA0116948_10892 [Chitinophaga costaii]|uniref:Uncharacterized protein n=1 Tax=Chitinophaga costaii TaxID=1335309 RepID=A0A1C4EGA8_9BACT|nr:hypothetical protein GA0116948_10892 [Chitinophaga costaii]